ncbi:hypothetical protein HY468_00170 [Candidatus Roizmanbacteria bacterium]|nr:hypothetical protein [Candidatus Roizmanbacteria bacterium]
MIADTETIQFALRYETTRHLRSHQSVREVVRFVHDNPDELDQRILEFGDVFNTLDTFINSPTFNPKYHGNVVKLRDTLGSRSLLPLSQVVEACNMPGRWGKDVYANVSQTYDEIDQMIEQNQWLTNDEDHTEETRWLSNSLLRGYSLFLEKYLQNEGVNYQFQRAFEEVLHTHHQKSTLYQDVFPSMVANYQQYSPRVARNVKREQHIKDLVRTARDLSAVQPRYASPLERMVADDMLPFDFDANLEKAGMLDGLENTGILPPYDRSGKPAEYDLSYANYYFSREEALRLLYFGVAIGNCPILAYNVTPQNSDNFFKSLKDEFNPPHFGSNDHLRLTGIMSTLEEVGMVSVPVSPNPYNSRVDEEATEQWSETHIAEIHRYNSDIERYQQAVSYLEIGATLGSTFQVREHVRRFYGER